MPQLPPIELARLLFKGTRNPGALLLLLLRLLFAGALFDLRFVTLLCCFLGVSRRLADHDPPGRCHLHEVLSAIARTIPRLDVARFVDDIDAVTSALARHKAITWSGLGWVGAALSGTDGHLKRLVGEGALVYDEGEGAFRPSGAYIRYVIEV